MDNPPPLRSFGRLKSRTIKPRQAALMTDLLPALRAPETPFDPNSLGFGGGEHMAAQAAGRRDILILGAEPFQNGVASALRHIEDADLKNVRLHDGDVRDMLARMPDACLDRVFILFPDPWPKARHNKRRLVNEDLLAELARLMRPGATLRFATDWADYADWTLERILKSPAYSWAALGPDDWRRPPADHITTRYEQKGLGDCAPVFLDFVRG